MALAVVGGYKRIETIMAGLLLVILVSFIVVAIKGLLDWRTWPALAAGLVAPFWSLPALLKAIIAMAGNLLLAPIAVAVIWYFINRRSMGELRANTGRNVVLGVTLLFALALAIPGVVRFFR